jgi:hypothetical protein
MFVNTIPSRATLSPSTGLLLVQDVVNVAIQSMLIRVMDKIFLIKLF